MKIFTFDTKKEKQVLAGEYSPELKTFYKKCNSKHFMCIEKGYGISEEVLQQLIQLDCRYIIIRTKTTTINSELNDWLKKPMKNYGSGNQRFIKVL